MKLTQYPTLDEVLELHLVLIKKFGGTSGVRDLGLLESALLRPQSGYYSTLSLQAASLLQGLLKNHAFLDGNKRVAFATTAIFLKLNGHILSVKAGPAEKFLIEKIICDGIELEEISNWLEQHMTAL